jgi:sulfoxide reductase heme-binding subunit YedZ
MTRRILIGIGIGLGLLVVLDAIAARMGLAPGVIPKLAGASAWITSRAAGVTAFVAITLDVAFGLLVSTGAADRLIPRARSVEVHRWLSSVALSMTAVHALALTGDRFVRFDVIDALVPFLSPYRPLAVGLGVLAAHAALLVHASFWLRRRIGVKTWRKLHFLSFFVFLSAIAHGLLAGTDADTAGMQALYVASSTLVGLLALHRVLGARAARAGTRRAGSARWHATRGQPRVSAAAQRSYSTPARIDQLV